MKFANFMTSPINYVDSTGNMQEVVDGNREIVPEPSASGGNGLVLPEDDILVGVAKTAEESYQAYLDGDLTLEDMLAVYGNGNTKDAWCLTAIMYNFSRHCLLKGEADWNNSGNKAGTPPPFVYKTRGTETLMEKYQSANRWYPVSRMTDNATHKSNLDFWPKVGDIILYDFADKNSGLKDGRPDHAALVTEAQLIYNGSSNSIMYTIIQGNWGKTMNKTEGLLFKNYADSHILGIYSNNNQYSFGGK